MADKTTNEELAEAIKSGNVDLIPQLWRQVLPFARMKAEKLCRDFQRPDFDADDLTQSAYFALLEALERWQPEAGCNFLTYFATCMKTAFADAGGWRTGKQKKQWQQMPLSLDAPVSEDDETTFAETIPDERNEYETVEERIYNTELRKELDALIDKLPQKQGEAVRSIYFDDVSPAELATVQGVSYARIQAIKSQGLNTLRRRIMAMPGASALREYVEERTAWRTHVGASTFQRTHTSEVERIVLQRDVLERNAIENIYLQKLPDDVGQLVKQYRDLKEYKTEVI